MCYLFLQEHENCFRHFRYGTNSITFLSDPWYLVVTSGSWNRVLKNKGIQRDILMYSLSCLCSILKSPILQKLSILMRLFRLEASLHVFLCWQSSVSYFPESHSLGTNHFRPAMQAEPKQQSCLSLLIWKGNGPQLNFFVNLKSSGPSFLPASLASALLLDDTI